MHDEAVGSLEKMALLTDRSAMHLGNLGMVFGLSGQKEKVRGIIHELESKARHEYVAPSSFAMANLGLKKQDAVDWFKTGFQKRDPLTTFVASLLLSDLRKNPNFKDLIGRMKIAI